MEAQSSPVNDKPVQPKPTSDLNALFEELEKRPSRQPQSPLAPPPSRTGAQALLGPASRRSVPPPPPPASKKPPVAAAPPSAPPPPAAAAQRIDDEAELIEDDDDADATGKREASSLDALLPKYDAEVDDAPTVARASPLSFPIPSRRSTPAPVSSGRLPPPPSARPSHSPSSIARLSAPAAPLKSASDLPMPSRSTLPALTPPPSRASTPSPSRPPASRAPAPPPAHAISAPLPSAPPTSIPAASVVVADSRPQQATIPPVSRSDSLAAAHAPMKKKSSAGVFLAVAGLGLLVAAAAVGIGFKDRLLAAAGGAPVQGAIVVTVAGANDAPLSSLRVLVDGKEHCTSTPCRVSLATGTHFVRAEAPGFVATADRAVSIEGSGETTLHISLSPAAGAAKGKPAEAVADLDTESKSAAPAGEPAAPAAAAAAPAAAPRVPGKLAAAAKPADKKEDEKPAKGADKPAAGVTGTLNINSIPVANVVLDGRPIGSTPIMGLAVSPGPHSVVFVHPEHGRKATGVTVEAGKTATAAVRF